MRRAAYPPIPSQRNPITSRQPYLDAIAYELNNCPRATLGYRIPTEAFNEHIATTHGHHRYKDHPHSRRENKGTVYVPLGALGSSPLTRGEPLAAHY